MKKCVFCRKETSFVYMGQGEYNNEPVCPAYQSKEFNTNFNTGCGEGRDSCLLEEKDSKKCE